MIVVVISTLPTKNMQGRWQTEYFVLYFSGIDWSTVRYSDLTKPLYSVLAARLVLLWYWEALQVGKIRIKKSTFKAS